MGFDLKDIADILPFILDNLSVCAYIIFISIILGFFVGKQFEKIKQKKKIADLEACIASEKEKRDVAKRESEMLKRKIEIMEVGTSNSQFASLSALERMLDSEEGQVDLTALIELNIKRGERNKEK